MTTAQSVLVNGVERAFFEKLVVSGMQGSPAMDDKKQYVDPIIRALFVGFVWGHIAGFTQGGLATREVFDKAFSKGAQGAAFAPTEVGTSAGLVAIDALLQASLEDLQAMLKSQGHNESELQISHFEHLIPHVLGGQAGAEPQKLAS